MTIPNGSKGIGYFTLALLGPSAAVTQQMLTSGGKVDYIARQWNGATVHLRRQREPDECGRAIQRKRARREVGEGVRGRPDDRRGLDRFQDTFAPLAVHVYVVAP